MRFTSIIVLALTSTALGGTVDRRSPGQVHDRVSSPRLFARRDGGDVIGGLLSLLSKKATGPCCSDGGEYNILLHGINLKELLFVQGVAQEANFVSQMAVVSMGTRSAMTVSPLSFICFRRFSLAFSFPSLAVGACCPPGSVYS